MVSDTEAYIAELERKLIAAEARYEASLSKVIGQREELENDLHVAENRLSDSERRVAELEFILHNTRAMVTLAENLLEKKNQQIDELEEKQRWIPVSERLPEVGPAVLVAHQLSVSKSIQQFSKSKKRGCPTCAGIDPKSCMRCRGRLRLCDWFYTDNGLQHMRPILPDMWVKGESQ